LTTSSEVLDNRVLWTKKDEIMGDWENMCNKELHNLHFSPNMIRVIKSRRMRQVGHVACMGW
jgi:hypothetical protein